MLSYGKSIVKKSKWWYGNIDLELLKRRKPDQPSREPPLKRAFHLQVCGDTVTLHTNNLEIVYQLFKTIGMRKKSPQMDTSEPGKQSRVGILETDVCSDGMHCEKLGHMRGAGHTTFYKFMPLSGELLHAQDHSPRKGHSLS